MRHFTPDFTPVHMYELTMSIGGKEYYRATLPEDETIEVLTENEVQLPITKHAHVVTEWGDEWTITRKPDAVISDQVVAQFPFHDNTGMKKYTGRRSFMKDTIHVEFDHGTYIFIIPNMRVVEEETEFCDNVFEYVKYVIDGKHYRLEYNGHIFDTMDDVYQQVTKDTIDDFFGSEDD